MHVVGDELRDRIVEMGQIGRRFDEGSVSLLRFLIADVLTDKNVRAHAERDGVL